MDILGEEKITVFGIIKFEKVSSKWDQQILFNKMICNASFEYLDG